MNARRFVLASCLVLAQAASASIAAEWSMAPTVRWLLDTSDNRRLDASNRSSGSLQLEASALLRRATETNEITATPRIALRRFAGDPVLDSDDGGLTLDAQHTTELGRIWLQASASREGTLTSELRDTGIVEGRQQRRATSGMLYASRAMSNRVSLSANAGRQSIRYSNAAASALVDYDYSNGTVAGIWQVSPRLQLTGRAIWSVLDAPTAQLSSRNRSWRLALDSDVSEQWSLGVSAGQATTESRSLSDRGAIYSANLHWRGLLTELSLQLSHDIAPTGRGVLVSRDEAALSVTRPLSSRLSVSATASLARNEDLLFGFFRNDRQYWNIVGRAHYRWSENLTLSAQFETARADYQFFGPTARSRGALVAFEWTPVKRSSSR